MRLSVTLACLLVAGTAAAESARVRWRGVVAVEGRAPAQLQAAVAAHVAVALKQLGSSLVASDAFDVEAAAKCGFPPSTKVAHCTVVVARARGGRVERRAEIRYRDAEDLAESLALLVSDILTADFADIVGVARSVNPPATGPPPVAPSPGPSPVGPSPVGPSPVNPPPPSSSTRAQPAPPPPASTTRPQPAPPPTPSPSPPPPPTPEQQKAHEAEMQRQLEIVKALQQQADEARAARERERPPAPPPPKLPSETRTAVGVGAIGLFGIGAANPTLAGGNARGLWSRGVLRAGASLSLAGMRQTIDTHDLSFFRALLAARAGVGLRGSVVDFDLTGGPALLVLVDDAHAEGRHAFASFAVAVGPRLGLTLSGPLALVAGADLDIAVTDEKITAGTARVAQFSRASVEISVGIEWRTR